MQKLHLILALFFMSAFGHFPSSAKAEVGFVGDLEGNWNLLQAFIDDGRVLYRSGDQVKLREGKVFVFAGDILDRDSNGIKILDTLLDLKKRYPNQVVLLAGNRDANKAGLNSPENLFQDSNERKSWDVGKIRAYLSMMNAPDAFNHRRAELERSFGRTVTDQEVAEDFTSDVSDSGRLTEYLKLSQLIYYDRQTQSLYVHGGLSKSNIGKVPEDAHSYNNVEEWVQRLNAWWSSLSSSMSDQTVRKTMMRYAFNPEGVIYSRFSDSTGNPQLPAQVVQEYLRLNSVHAVVVGHTPVGNLPGVVSSPDLKIILGDLSYSKGLLSSVIRITDHEIEIDSKLEDGRLVQAYLPLLGTAPDGIGTLASGHRIVGRVKGSSNYIGWRVGESFTNLYDSKQHCEWIINGGQL